MAKKIVTELTCDRCKRVIPSSEMYAEVQVWGQRTGEMSSIVRAADLCRDCDGVWKTMPADREHGEATQCGPPPPVEPPKAGSRAWAPQRPNLGMVERSVLEVHVEALLKRRCLLGKREAEIVDRALGQVCDVFGLIVMEG